jgi:hypothetical protein
MWDVGRKLGDDLEILLRATRSERGVQASTRAGVWLCIVPDTIIAPTAELTVGLTLDLLRNIRHGDAIVRGGHFTGWRTQLYGATLRGATVGIIGMGQLGTAVANLLAPSGIARLRYTDQHKPLPPARGERAMSSAGPVSMIWPIWSGCGRRCSGRWAILATTSWVGGAQPSSGSDAASTIHGSASLLWR